MGVTIRSLYRSDYPHASANYGDTGDLRLNVKAFPVRIKVLQISYSSIHLFDAFYSPTYISCACQRVTRLHDDLPKFSQCSHGRKPQFLIRLLFHSSWHFQRQFNSDQIVPDIPTNISGLDCATECSIALNASATIAVSHIHALWLGDAIMTAVIFVEEDTTNEARTNTDNSDHRAPSKAGRGCEAYQCKGCHFPGYGIPFVLPVIEFSLYRYSHSLRYTNLSLLYVSSVNNSHSLISLWWSVNSPPNTYAALHQYPKPASGTPSHTSSQLIDIY
ncbi:hypothetical protein BDR04DRAFT_198965 [Suillus decipiens]|nr:hypothetical protein BDR04DRAFT_198965 [Suillus decipiens]